MPACAANDKLYIVFKTGESAASLKPEGDPTVDIYRTARAGSCDVTLTVRDSAGLAATTVTTVRYQQPRN